jgi:hypothetical protein
VPLCFRTAQVKMLYLLFVDAYICTYVHAYISTALIDTRRFHRVQLCSTTYSVPFYQVMYILFYILPNTYLNITQQAAMNKLCYYFTSVVLFSKMLKVFLRLYGTISYSKCRTTKCWNSNWRYQNVDNTSCPILTEPNLILHTWLSLTPSEGT